MLAKFSVKKYGTIIANGLPLTRMTIFPSQIFAAAVSERSVYPTD